MITDNKIANFVKTRQSISEEFCKIYNNAKIELNARLSLKYLGEKIHIGINVYISKHVTCGLCTIYQDYANSLDNICECFERRELFDCDCEDIILDTTVEYMKENDYLIKTIKDNIDTLLHTYLKVFNTIKYCDSCSIVINSENDICNSCKWQEIYNIKYGVKIEDCKCSICHEELYHSDSVSICGTTSHSIHKRCKKNIKKCPLCRQN